MTEQDLRRDLQMAMRRASWEAKCPVYPPAPATPEAEAEFDRLFDVLVMFAWDRVRAYEREECAVLADKANVGFVAQAIRNRE